MASDPIEFDRNSSSQQECGTFVIWHICFQKETLIPTAI